MESGDIEKIPAYLREYFNERSQFHYYLEYKKNSRLYRNIDNKFICLKGLASSTPVVNSASFNNGSIGGGFYFRFKGVGIAVDPGIGFVSLMHQNNIFIDDINVVIVTHNHLDHNCDVSTLSSLLYDYNRDTCKDAKFYEDVFGYKLRGGHTIEWYLDEDTKEATQSILDGAHVHALSNYIAEDGENISPTEDYEIKLSAIRTQHIKNNDRTYGVKLCFSDDDNKYVWGYTSDTARFDGLTEYFKDCNALIFNISDVYVKDVRLLKDKHSHLGFKGSLELLQGVRPRLALVSEFCCTNGDYRLEIVRALAERLSDESVKIFPADRGLDISLALDSLKCSICQKEVPIDTVKIVRPQKEYADFQYLCSNCML